MTRSGFTEDNSQVGAGLDYYAEAGAPDDVIRFSILGEAFPRLVIKPSTGQVFTGNGTVYPATELGTGGGGGTDLSAIGTYLTNIPAEGAPGFVDPVAGDDSAGWLSMIADAVHSRIGAGFGSADEILAVLNAGANVANLVVTLDGGYTGLSFAANPTNANMQLAAVAGQSFPLLIISDGGGNPVLFITPSGADDGVSTIGLGRALLDIGEQAGTPGTPPADTARLYALDDGSGGTTLRVILPDATDHVIAPAAGGGGFPISYDDGTYTYEITAAGGALTLTTTENLVPANTSSVTIDRFEVAVDSSQRIRLVTDTDANSIDLESQDTINLSAVNGTSIGAFGEGISFYSTGGPQTQQTVVGDCAGNAALAALFAALENVGLIVDSTSAGTAPPDLSAIGTFLDPVPATSEPGWVDPGVGNDTKGWITAEASSGAGDVQVGYGSAGSDNVQMVATNGQSDLTVASGAARIQLIANAALYTLMLIELKIAQTNAAFDIHDHSGNPIFTVVPSGADDGGAYVDMHEMGTPPAAPGFNGGRLFFQDNGSGKTQLMVKFASGAAQVIATQP